jgi:hypothetical protein
LLLAYLSLTGLIALAGCNRQDTESLASIGRKILDRTASATATCRERLGGLNVSRGGAEDVQERVKSRLRWEKMLANTPIEVVVSGEEIELKGIVATAEQRSRAVELAESTTGVQRVLVSLIIGEEKKAE